MFKHIFIDMDGTIVPLIGDNGKVTQDNFSKDNFFDKELPLRTVIEALYNVFPSSEYIYHILSASPDTKGVTEKNRWLDKWFPVKDSNRHFVIWKQETKGQFLNKYCALKDIDIHECVLIDDDINNLIDVESYGVVSYHVSRLLSESERMEERK